MHSPRYAVYVMVDEPRPNARSHGYATGGWVAAPAFAETVRRIGPILGVMPETERAPAIAASLTMPLRPARPAAAPARGIPAAQPAARPRALPATDGAPAPAPAPVAPPPARREARLAVE
jgi:cell division protein FtsI (penicillin-binding protein 3)